MHMRPLCVQGEPSLGTTGGQPEVVGGFAQFHLGGGAMHGPPMQLVQTQMSSLNAQAMPSLMHVVPSAGSMKPHAGDTEHEAMLFVQLPL